MIQSMTAYGRTEDSSNWGQAVCEIRSVNHRYLEMLIRLPEELRVLEPVIRGHISNKLKRGKVDCNIHLEHKDVCGEALPINQAFLERIIKTVEQTGNRLRSSAPINPLELLSWPGVLDRNVPDLEALKKPLLQLLDNTLETVIETRQREGRKIKAMISERCHTAKDIISQVRQQGPQILDRIREKLTQRIQELVNEVDNERLEQELLLLAQKIDVAEEMDRLDAHIEEVLRVLEQDEPVGRRLDFLMQEMNREANTLASKSAHLQSTNSSVDLKVLIEQMREQIQNIE